MDIWSGWALDFDQPVRDPLWGNIMMPRSFAGIADSPEMVKLSRIMQLGPAHLVYPGATHTRRAHSFGVFEMAKRSLAAIAGRGDVSFVDGRAARSFLVAALCHDLGHFPYAHSLKELPLREHESLAADMLTGRLRDVVLRAGADPELAAAIVDTETPEPDGAGSALGLFRAMLSGVLDPDKLDYLNRDAWSCGVPYGLQDVGFIFQHLGLDAGGVPGIDPRGAMAVEAVLFSKYQMYRAVYWNRSVRAATAMIKTAVIDNLSSGRLEPEQLYGLDDAGFYGLMEGDGLDGRHLIASVRNGALMQPCLEVRYDPDIPAHAQAADLSLRPHLEAGLARAAGVKTVIIDVPEPISFETSLPVTGTGLRFPDYATVFRPDVVSSFAGALRIVRVFADGDECSLVAGPAMEMLGGPPSDR